MIRNYLKTALRNFRRYRGYTLLNVAGLSLGLIVSLLITLWVRDEMSYDRFHADGDRIYQVMNNMGLKGNKIETWTGSPAPYHRIFAKDLPEVEHATAYIDDSRPLQREGGEAFEERGVIASPNFFNFFSFPLIAGDTSNVFAEPKQVAISAEVAAKLFGSDWRQGNKALGQTIRLREVGDFNVSAVFADVPEQSSIQFDYAVSLEDYYALDPEARNHYGNFYLPTFVRLAPRVEAADVNPKLAGVVNANSGRDFAKEAIFLHPLEKKYLYSKFTDGRSDGGRIEYVRLFSAAAVFILLIACINYMNLTTARSTRRAREIGIRKVVGATRRVVFGQFMTESILTSLICTAVAVTAAQLLLPAFNDITGKTIAIDFTRPAFWGVILGLSLLTGVLAGSYPALALSSFRITHILKGRMVKGFNDIHLRRGLVIVQFVLSVLLVVGALVVRDQIRYINNKDLGLEKNNVLLVRLPQDVRDKYSLLKDELGKLPEVQKITGSDGNPLRVGSATGDPEWEGFDESKRQVFSVLSVDHDFLETMNVQLATGQDFDEAMARDTTSRNYLLNETAAAAMGLDEPLGKQLKFWGDEGRIIGVVRDFHIASLHLPIQPLIIRLDPGFIETILLRPQPGQTATVISALEKIFKGIAPQAPLKYEFLDQSFASMYQAEQTTARLADFFALAAILISCLGLLGLTAFSAELRTKEIGVRKVLGASVSNLVWLLNRELSLLLVVAFVLGAPLAWYLLRGWLQRFAYHVELGWRSFALTGFLLLLVAALTVSYHSLRAARSNPAESLKYE